MSGIEEKIDQILKAQDMLGPIFTNIEKNIDTIKEEIKCMRVEASRNSERITRLEEGRKNHEREMSRIDQACSENLQVLSDNIDDRVDKKLAGLKVALLTASISAVIAIAGIIIQLWSIR